MKVAVRTADGKAPPSGSEVAVAAVDEGLLELLPNKSWDVLDALMDRRAYTVSTATAQGQVVGKRHFGLKALPQGGGEKGAGVDEPADEAEQAAGAAGLGGWGGRRGGHGGRRTRKGQASQGIFSQTVGSTRYDRIR